MLRSFLLFVLVLSSSGVLARANGEPLAKQYAMILQPDGVDAASREAVQMIDALSAEGYQGIPAKQLETWHYRLSDNPLRRVGNVLKDLISVNDTLLIYHQGHALSDGKDIFLSNKGQTSLTKLLSPLTRPGVAALSVLLVLDVTSNESTETLASSIAVIRADLPRLSVLLAQRDNALPDSWFCDALRGKRGDVDRNGVITPKELVSTLGDDANAVYLPADHGNRHKLGSLQPRDIDELIDVLGRGLLDKLEKRPADLVVVPDRKITVGELSPRADILGRFLTEQIRRRLEDAGIRLVPQKEFNQIARIWETTTAAIDKQADSLMQALATDPNERIALILINAEMDLSTVKLFVEPQIAWATGARTSASAALPKTFVQLDANGVAMTGAWNMSPRVMKEQGFEWGWDVTDLDSMPTGTPHPMSYEGCELKVYLEVNGRRTKYYFSEDDRQMYVPVGKGDEYTIVVENFSNTDLFLRLLVDGRNTLPDRPSGQGPLEPAPYVSLTRARCYFCKAGVKFRVTGFCSYIDQAQLGQADARWRSFKITDANSVHAPNEYREQLGIITAAFYETVSKDSVPMSARVQYATEPGTTHKEKVSIYEGDRTAGRLVGDAPINIHYGLIQQGTR